MFCPKCGKNQYVIFSTVETGDEDYPYQRNIRCAQCGALISATKLVTL